MTGNSPPDAAGRRSLLKWLGGGALLAAGGGYLATVRRPVATGEISLTIDRNKPGMPIAPDFAGFSYEKDRVSYAFFNGENQGLIALLRRLGPGLIRIGGNSVDATNWTPGGRGMTKGEVAPPDVDALAAFLRATGWKVLYGLNLVSNMPARLAAEAVYAAKALGDRLQGFEIGNEPDYYSSTGARASTYSYADFVAEWSACADTLVAAVPGAFLTGPGSALFDKAWSVRFANVARVRQLTQHYYRGNGETKDATLANLLGGDPALTKLLQQLQSAAAKNGIAAGYRLTEANSYSNGGAPNVSNRPQAALWLIDFLFACARQGAAGVNLHGGGSYARYSPLSDDNRQVTRVGPEYYALLLFSLARGSLLASEIQTAGRPVSAYATADGSVTHVVITNKGASDAVDVIVSLGRGAASADALLLDASNQTRTIFGGQTVGTDGYWVPRQAVRIAVARGALRVTVPPSSAMLVTAR